MDIAALGLEVRSDGVVVASNRLRKFEQDAGRAERATDRYSSIWTFLALHVRVSEWNVISAEYRERIVAPKPFWASTYEAMRKAHSPISLALDGAKGNWAVDGDRRRCFTNFCDMTKAMPSEH